MSQINLFNGNDIFKAKWIILADDDKDDVDLFCEVLRDINANLKFIVAEDGVILMNILNKLEDLPDLIFLDINMPRKNGFLCLKEIKEHPTLRSIKIIMMSTSASSLDINRCYQGGADLYVIKSTNYNSFSKIITGCLQMDWNHLHPELGHQ